MKDKYSRDKGNNNWTAWRQVTPLHNQMVDSILQCGLHVITTMRSRMEYVQDTDERGKTFIRKVGLAPIQRPGMEYEFDVVADMDINHVLSVSKSRCRAVDGVRLDKPGYEFASALLAWLNDGQPVELGKPISSAAAVEPEINLTYLVEKYGVDKIMAVTGGMIPANDDEVWKAYTELEAEA